jgi:hypothetical protein
LTITYRLMHNCVQLDAVAHSIQRQLPALDSTLLLLLLLLLLLMLLPLLL